MSGKRVPPKVSGLVRSGALTEAPAGLVQRMPSFDSENNFNSSIKPDITEAALVQESSSDHSQPSLSPISTSPLKTEPPLQNSAVKEIINNVYSSENEGNVVFLAVDKIRSSPFQNRNKIDESYVADLAENIKHDGLHQPIVVRLIDEDIYELIAGEHRLEAHKLLGLTEAPVLIRKATDLEAARALVFDNIFHRPPTDFEIFKGFEQLIKLDSSLSLRSLAKDTGWSFSQVQRIMSFRNLPERAIEILSETPSLIGSTVADVLAKHTKLERSEYVIEALELIRDGRLTQMRADTWIKSRTNTKPNKTNRVLTYSQGKQFCTLTRDGSNINIKVAPGIDTAHLEEAVFEILRQRAEAEKLKETPHA